ncbi:MAG: hypothetical protein WBB94_01595 [Candidatus Saccharimonadaceae bacterium]
MYGPTELIESVRVNLEKKVPHEEAQEIVRQIKVILRAIKALNDTVPRPAPDSA